MSRGILRLFLVVTAWTLRAKTLQPGSRSSSFLLNMSSSFAAVEDEIRIGFESAEEAVDLSVNYINSRVDLLPGANLTFDTVYSTAKEKSVDVEYSITSQGVREPGPQPCGKLSILFWPSIISCSMEEGQFSLVPTPTVYAKAVMAIVDHFRWRRISIITKGKPCYHHVLSELMEAVKLTSIEIINSTEENLFPRDVRIFFLNMNASDTVEVLCEALRQNKRFPHYVWLSYDKDGGRGLKETICEERTSCSLQEEEDALDGVLLVSSRIFENQFPAVTGFIDFHNSSRSLLNFFAFDAVWMLTHVYGKVYSNSTDSKGTLSSFCSVAHNMSISGLTGPISFDACGCRRVHLLGMTQFRKQEGEDLSFALYPVAQINVTLSESAPSFGFIIGENSSTIFRGSTPHDGTPLKQTHHHPVPLIVVYCTLATAGLLFVIVCLLFTIIFRHRRIVRLTSPNLNFFMLLGATLLYLSVYVRLYPTTDRTFTEVICNVQVIFTLEGYALCFAPVVMKMLRINYIFHNPFNSAKKPLRDFYLAVGIFILVGIISLLLLLSVAVPALRPDITLVLDKERPSELNEDNITINYCIFECYGARSYLPLAWTGVEVLYLFSLQVAALVLAVANRNVKIEVLNDFKEMSVIVYTVTIMLVPMFAVTYGVSMYTTISEALLSGAIMSATTVFLFFTFVPKMRVLYKDPKGRNIFPMDKRTNSISESASKSTTISTVLPSVTS